MSGEHVVGSLQKCVPYVGCLMNMGLCKQATCLSCYFAGPTADNIHRFTKSSKLQQCARQGEGTGMNDAWQLPPSPWSPVVVVVSQDSIDGYMAATVSGIPCNVATYAHNPLLCPRYVTIKYSVTITHLIS